MTEGKFIPAIGIKDPDSWWKLKERIMQLLDFNTIHYRDNFLKRRVEVRLRSMNISSYNEYMDYFSGHEDERNLLLKELTIHVTHFFRDFKLYRKLKNEVFPKILTEKEEQSDLTVNIWSAGCSSGQEPYSIAIVLHDLLGDRLKKFSIRIDALDISPRIIEAAKMGLYSESSFGEMPKDYKEKYFVKEGETYTIDGAIKDMVTFKVGDIMHHDTVIKYDLVLCRNTVIYFERETKKSLYESIFRKMKKGGYLVLGKTEFLDGSAREKFIVFDNNERIYLLPA